MKDKINKNNTPLNNNFESDILKKSNLRFIRSIGIAASILLSIIVIACILSIYNFFKEINIYLGIGVLIIIIVLLIIFILRPIIIALSSPSFTLDITNNTDLNKVSKKNHKKLVKIAKNIISTNTLISEQQKEFIKNNLNNKKELPSILKTIYDKEVKKDINNLIYKTAADTLVVTAMSQSNKLDTLSTIFINVKLIMQIVIRCGYRPSYAQLSKLIVKVLRNAIIAYAIESFDIGNLVADGVSKLVNDIPFVKTLTKSVTEGAANALLTLRIGFLTRKYLYEEYDVHQKINDRAELNNQLLKDAVKEANDNIGEVVKNCNKKQKVNI